MAVMTEYEELLLLRKVVEDQKKIIADQKEQIEKQRIQIENLTQAVLHARKKYMALLQKLPRSRDR